jgi:hypothetical protein
MVFWAEGFWGSFCFHMCALLYPSLAECLRSLLSHCWCWTFNFLTFCIRNKGWMSLPSYLPFILINKYCMACGLTYILLTDAFDYENCQAIPAVIVLEVEESDDPKSTIDLHRFTAIRIDCPSANINVIKKVTVYVVKRNWIFSRKFSLHGPDRPQSFG